MIRYTFVAHPQFSTSGYLNAILLFYDSYHSHILQSFRNQMSLIQISIMKVGFCNT